MAAYRNPEGGLGGVERFRRANNLSRKEAIRILQRDDAYTLHKQQRKRFKRRPIIALYKDELHQSDLADMSKYKKYNRGMRYILVVIDTLSRYLYAVPIKSKRPQDVKRAFVKIFRQATPRHLLTDRGTEYYNKVLRAYFKRKKVNHYSIHSACKAASAERVIRTLKERLFRYFRSTGKYTYLNILPRIVADYNNTVHSTTKMKPNEVNASNAVELFNRLNSKTESNARVPFKIGDQVRISLDRDPFTKSYTGLWSPEVFTVSRIRHTNPPVLHLRDVNGEELKGAFYVPEVQRVVKESTDKWPIERVLRRKKINGVPHLLVRWLGYDSTHDSWIAAKNVGRL